MLWWQCLTPDFASERLWIWFYCYFQMFWEKIWPNHLPVYLFYLVLPIFFFYLLFTALDFSVIFFGYLFDFFLDISVTFFGFLGMQLPDLAKPHCLPVLFCFANFFFSSLFTALDFSVIFLDFSVIFFWISRNAVAWFGPTSLFTAVADNHKKLARPSESPTNSPRSWLTRFLLSESVLPSLKVCSLPLRNKVHRALSSFMKIFTPVQLSCNPPLFWFWRKN